MKMILEVIDLLIDQIEFANVIILNKIDLLEKEDVIELHQLLQKLNPNAKLLNLPLATYHCKKF